MSKERKLEDLQGYEFEKSQRGFYLTPTDKEYKALKKEEEKRIKRATKKFKKDLEKLKKTGEEWFYEGP